jgi:hypothetical protein
MKKSIILLSLIVNITLVFAQRNEITIVNVDEDVLVFSQSTLDTLALKGLQIKIDQYTNISDWNDDGLNDIILTIASEDTITAYVALFKRQDTNGELQFVEDPNYLMNAKGRVANFESTAGDINEDGLLDIVIVTENYHGPQGQQPPYYLGGEFTPDKLFINNGQGFNYFELDTTMRYINGIWQYWASNAGQIFDWDLDGDLEVLISDPNYARIRESENPEYNKLFSSFDINSNDSISREFVFEWPLSEQWINTDLRLFKTINDTLYLAHYNTVGWDTLDSVFVDQSLIDNGRYIRENQYEVLIFDINQSFGINGLIDSVVLVSDKRGGFIVENGYWVSDIDHDGEMEYVTNWFNETNTVKENYIRIFDDDGTDITEEFMPIEWFEDPRNGGDGITVIDLNNDGYDDILPRNGWNNLNNQNWFISYALFLNDSGNRFIRYDVDFTSSPDFYTGIFNHPIDIDNDGYYEILNILHSYDTPNVDITTLDYTGQYNFSPTDFSLTEPSNNTQITIDESNMNTDHITFSWDASSDQNGDPLYYLMRATSAEIGDHGMDTNATSFDLSYMDIIEDMSENNVTAASLEWTVYVTDGQDTVEADNAPFTIEIEGANALSAYLEGLLPDEFALHQNYPNPFNPITTLRYDLPEQSMVNIIIYDLLGRQIRTLINQTQDAGFKSVIWDATNDYGKPVSAGVYLYQIHAGEFVQTKKMVLLK